jgi:endoglucanase Acf2
MTGKNLLLIRFTLIICISTLIIIPLHGQIIKVGEGSYTKTFPGVDAAGRNTFPSGTPMVIGNALNKPIPTNDWWSAKLKSNHVSNLFSYPTTLKTVNSGLVLTYIPWGVIDDQEPLIVGVTALNASRANVSDFSDWTVTMNWSNSTQSLTATAGIAMPFVYFTKNQTDVAQVTVNAGTVTISNEMLVIENIRNGADFAVFAPSGSEWIKNGKAYTSTLNGKNYWSVAHLPSSATSVKVAADTYKKYAYVFPKNTTTTWNYNESTSVVRTDFTITPDIKEGNETKVLQGLLPHQWNNLATDSPVPAEYTYKSVRGEIKTLAGNSFSVENTFYGILPTLPYVDNYSEGFSPSELNKKIQSIENDGLSTWTDSYNEGQVMNRLIQTARIADLAGNTVSRDKMLATVKERLEDWLTYETGEVAFLFYYNTAW